MGPGRLGCAGSPSSAPSPEQQLSKRLPTHSLFESALNFLNLGVLAVLGLHPSILTSIHCFTANLPNQPGMVFGKVVMLVTRLMVNLVVNLVVSLVVGMVRWPRPFLVLADFKSQPGLFAHLAHLSKQCKNVTLMRRRLLIVKLTLPSLLLPLPLLLVRLACSCSLPSLLRPCPPP